MVLGTDGGDPGARARGAAVAPSHGGGARGGELLTDASSELVFPLLPAFLAALGASNAFIGLVEGAAELVASVLKYATGLAADRLPRLKPLVLAVLRGVRRTGKSPPAHCAGGLRCDPATRN